MENLKSIVTIFNDIKKNPSILKKTEILNSHAKDTLFVSTLAWYLTPQIKTGLAKAKMAKGNEIDLPVEESFSSLTTFEDVLNWIQVNNTGSNQAIANIHYWINTYGSDDAEFWKDFFTKSFKLGLSRQIANKVFGPTFIKVFDVQLAYLYEKKIEKFPKNQEYVITQKLDGFRCLTTVSKSSNINVNNIDSYTRNGVRFNGMTQMHESLFNFLNSFDVTNELGFKNGIAFDGELLLRNDDDLDSVSLFQKTSKHLREDNEKENIIYNIFDILPLEDFESDTFTMTYNQRRAKLNHLIELANLHMPKFITIVPELARINDKDEIPKWSEYATDAGWEGVMLNTTTGVYKKKRSTELLKVKKFYDADLQCVGVYEGDGRNKGTLGGITVKLNDTETVNVGSGFSDADRKEYWAHPEKIINQVAIIKYFEVSHDRNGGTSLRFPTFKDIRTDKTLDEVDVF